MSVITTYSYHGTRH